MLNECKQRKSLPSQKAHVHGYVHGTHLLVVKGAMATNSDTSASLKLHTDRLATFNMLATRYTKFCTKYHGGPDAPPGAVETASQRDARYALNLQVIRDLHATILLTQEHDFGLGTLPGLPYGARVAVEDRNEGCGVFAGQPLQWSMGLDLGDGKTGMVACLGTGLLVASVHLKGGRDTATAKLAQINRLLEIVDAHPGRPCVIAGDMNDTAPGCAPFGLRLQEAGFTLVPAVGPTGLTSMTSERLVPLELDHVFVRGVESATLAFGVPGVAPGAPWGPDVIVGSDHVPLVLDVMYRVDI